MPDIFDEVEEDLRADRARALLVRYGGALFAAALLAVAAAGGWQVWRSYDARRVAVVAKTYLAGMRIADEQKGAARAAAVTDFATVAATGADGYRTLARLRAAALKAESGDLAGADALWNAVSSDGSADPLLRDLATLQWAQHHIDAGDPAAVAQRLAVLASPVNPWHALAEEAQAELSLRQGNTDAARATLTALTQDMSSPAGVRRRAGGLLARLGG